MLTGFFKLKVNAMAVQDFQYLRQQTLVKIFGVHLFQVFTQRRNAVATVPGLIDLVTELDCQIRAT